MATHKYTHQPHFRRPRSPKRSPRGLPDYLYGEHMQRLRNFPVTIEIHATCTQGMNRGRCRACFLRALQLWQVDIKAYFRAAAKARQDAYRAWLQQAYGMVDPQYETLFIAQEGVCALCGNAETRHKNGILLPLSVDHSHRTGEVRALLCARCNLSLGHIETRGLRWVRRAVQYLKRHMSASEQARFLEENRDTSPLLDL
jgi:Recombination endonuclease VII